VADNMERKQITLSKQPSDPAPAGHQYGWHVSTWKDWALRWVKDHNRHVGYEDWVYREMPGVVNGHPARVAAIFSESAMG